jgi:hypothetical protein
MKKIKIIQMGLGGVGRGVVRMVAESNWGELVGVVDIDSNITGKDAGEVAGLSEPIGIVVTNDVTRLYATLDADIVVISTSDGTLESILPDVIEPLSRGINVVTPCMDASDPYLYNADLSSKIQDTCLKNNATFLGVGSTQLVARSLLAISETCRNIVKVTCLVHADVTKFPVASKQHEFGILLSSSDYETAVDTDTLRGRKALRKEAILIAKSLKLEYDETVSRYEPILENDVVMAVSHRFKVLNKGKVVVDYVYKFIEDPKHQYFHEFAIDATPSVNARIDFSLDRGIEGTIVPLVHCIPSVVVAAPGIMSMLDLPPGFRCS